MDEFPVFSLVLFNISNIPNGSLIFVLVLNQKTRFSLRQQSQALES